MQNLTIPIRANLDLTPEILGYLASIKEFEYSYKYYQLRHPGGIFNLATIYLIDDFIKVIDLVELQQTDYDSKRDIEERYHTLINSFFKFYDSCFEIIQGCCKEHERPKRDIWQWLEKNKYNAGTEFYEKTKEDIDYFRKIYNKLKHTSNHLQPISFLGAFNVVGYYVQSVCPEGSIGPDEDIHHKFQGKHSASSYNFDLKRLYYCIYECCFILKEALLKHFKEVYALDLTYNDKHKETGIKWRQFFEKMSSLPENYFPSEQGKPIYQLKIENGNLVFKIKSAPMLNLSGYKIELLENGDSFSRSFRLPFF